MGKRARKTRWRALDIADDHSDSEESNTNSSAVSSRYSHSNGYYSKYPYSSQSTPARRRYNQYDGSTKSTRSSSTTSEHKITFNEDEYTKITTPRQDVLFKKGYLNKPKTYQTQTSTGNSTISTGTSTENGTPDHQSTDLDYESQFVFPNGFVDQHGIYYVNSYEPYPVMVFNPPTYCQDFSNSKLKRYSTGSLSESMSPNNEEATSQDLSQSGGEASNSGGVSDYSGAPIFNMVYPGYYVNGTCTPNDLANGHHNPSEPVKKLKKRRERKSSKTIPGDSSEFTDNSSDENTPLHRVSIPENQQNSSQAASRIELPPTEKAAEMQDKSDKTVKTVTTNHDQSLSNGCSDDKTETNEKTSSTAQAQPSSQKTSTLKPDAEEFIPRAYQHIGPPPHIKMMPPNFVPIPLVPIGEYGAQNFAPHPAFIPPGFPINFVPHPMGQKIFHSGPGGFVSYPPPVVHETRVIEEKCDHVEDSEERESTATPSHTPVVDEAKSLSHNKIIDIATVMSKLEAVKQERQEPTLEVTAAKPVVKEINNFKGPPRTNNTQSFKRNFYNKYRDSPIRSGETSPQILNNNDSRSSLPSSPHHFRQPHRNGEEISHRSYKKSPVRHIEEAQADKTLANEKNQVRNSPVQIQKKLWKPNVYQNNHNSSKIQSNYHPQKQVITNGIEKTHPSDGYLNKNYSNSSKKVQPIEEPRVETSPKIKSSSQWISVSSRKKKKNKNIEDPDMETNEKVNNDSTDNSSDLFETYDITQLVDVVPPLKSEEQDKRIEDILTNIAETKAAEVLSNGQTTPANIIEVRDIEKSIVMKVEEEGPQELPGNETLLSGAENKIADEIDENVEEAFKRKKKSKKGTQKPLPKKVIITDIFNDIPVTPPVETKPAVKKITQKSEEVKQTVVDPEAPIEESIIEPIELDKKSKKKKKNKAAKPPPINDNTITDIISESNTAANDVDKTNDEISLELEKLIQKGMYTSLQEKIKLINVEPDVDDFFKSVGSLTAPDKTAVTLKTPDFNRIFQSTRQFLKPNMVSVDNDYSSKNKVAVDDDTDSKANCSSTADAADPTAGLAIDKGPEIQEVPEEDSDKTLYPITLAVKEWMSKTREATPEVEILKSPSTIQKEFGGVLTTDQLDSDLDDEEVTLFSSEESLNQDLLEYWDDELLSPPPTKDCDLLSKDIVVCDGVRKLCTDGNSCDKCRTDSIKQGEEEIEVYESKYGRNDTFLHLQTQLKEKQLNELREGRLPHRAVCCSLQ